MSTAKLTRKTIAEKLTADQIVMSKGVVTVRDEFFYTHGLTVDSLIARVKAAFPEAVIIDSGEHWAPFRGGASVAQSSHWFVKFTSLTPRQAAKLDTTRKRESPCCI